MTKFIQDSQVAVLYSPGYGAGWSTWAEDAEAALLMFDPHIVQLVLDRDQGALTITEFVQRVEQIFALKSYTSYCSPAAVEIRWLDPGTEFKITEYDGSESIVIKEQEIWCVA